MGMLLFPGREPFPNKEPKWTRFAVLFFKDKAIQSAVNIMSQQAIKETWPGTML